MLAVLVILAILASLLFEIVLSLVLDYELPPRPQRLGCERLDMNGR